MSQDLIPIAEAAEEMGINVKSVFRMLKQGRLKRYQRGLGRRTYVDRAEVRELLVPKPAVAAKKARPRRATP